MPDPSDGLLSRTQTAVSCTGAAAGALVCAGVKTGAPLAVKNGAIAALLIKPALTAWYSW